MTRGNFDGTCIFCDEGGLPDDCKECPTCHNPPFSGMMFDPERKERADGLENGGDLGGAWEILSDEWMAHTDMDYYDDEMACKLSEWIYELFDRNPGMIEQRVQMKLMEMSSMHYWGLHEDAIGSAEDAMRIAREAERPDLELEALESHLSVQSSRYGGRHNIPQQKDIERYLREILKRLEKSREDSE